MREIQLIIYEKMRTIDLFALCVTTEQMIRCHLNSSQAVFQHACQPAVYYVVIEDVAGFHSHCIE